MSMKVKSFIKNIITICLIIVICICGYKIYSKLYEYKKADNIYNDLRKEKNYTNENSSNKKNKNKENKKIVLIIMHIVFIDIFIEWFKEFNNGLSFIIIS